PGSLSHVLLALTRSQQLDEIGKLIGAKIGNGPERHAILAPMQEVVAAAAARCGAVARATAFRPDVKIDHVLAPLVDQRRDRLAGEIVQTPARQRKAFRREVL